MVFKLLKKETDVVNRDRMKIIKSNSAKEKYFTDQYFKEAYRLKHCFRIKNYKKRIQNNA